MSDHRSDDRTTTAAFEEQDLELGLQELEALEAPGWGTIGGISAGASVSALVSAAVVIT
ncbi:daptide-type RiPP [Streptomyces pilosus]|uniref:Uncharacterized protein n=1 Tax=Streptomyces pilosus TaxID=28893 RepID=A0A918C2B2_9ACTN|nr:daptide-type RiPP [Streptomyces pilosus]GGR01841.1 hypothetical protein GCM10010280_57220 [Streptomyces pilosus]GGV65067.1 hypothetical protein GCM10010261_56250 [Streptomyces pilosus]